jgi:hypothetical protein
MVHVRDELLPFLWLQVSITKATLLKKHTCLNQKICGPWKAPLKHPLLHYGVCIDCEESVITFLNWTQFSRILSNYPIVDKGLDFLSAILGLLSA